MLTNALVYRHLPIPPVSPPQGRPGFFCLGWPWSHVCAKARNNYMPRFLFYFKIRLLFIKNRFKNKKRKNASPARAGQIERHQV
jgi:hypothetical protein